MYVVDAQRSRALWLLCSRGGQWGAAVRRDGLRSPFARAVTRVSPTLPSSYCLCPFAALSAISTKALQEFVDAGGNVVVVADQRLPESWALLDFSEECGVHFASPGSVVIDHVSSSSVDHTLVKSSAFFDSKYAVGDSKSKGPVAFRGIAQSLRAENILAVPILTGAPTTYSAIPTEVRQPMQHHKIWLLVAVMTAGRRGRCCWACLPRHELVG